MPSIAPYLVDSGPGNLNLGTNVFYIWGSTCFGCIVFAYFCVPETKGLSLEQIDLLYQNVAPVNSIAFRKRMLAEGNILSNIKETRDDDVASNDKA